MGNATKSVIAAGLLAGGVIASTALYAHGGMMSGDSMMGDESGGMMSGDSMMGKEPGNMMDGMMGMMQQMNRMMENCNEMMESHADTQPKPDAPEEPAG